MFLRSTFAVPLLIALIGVMLFVRMVDPHWHQHLGEPGDEVALSVADAPLFTHLANSASPHSVDHLDLDVTLLAAEGMSSLPGLDAPAIVVLLLLWIVTFDRGRAPWRRACQRAPLHQRRLPALPPPLCGPPAYG